MNVNASNLRCKFAKMKYDQLLTEKYFVETCFSKKSESYTEKQKLVDILFKLGCNK